MEIDEPSTSEMMNRSYPILPIPEIIESNLNHSFKVSILMNS